MEILAFGKGRGISLDKLCRATQIKFSFSFYYTVQTLSVLTSYHFIPIDQRIHTQIVLQVMYYLLIFFVLTDFDMKNQLFEQPTSGDFYFASWAWNHQVCTTLPCKSTCWSVVRNFTCIHTVCPRVPLLHTLSFKRVQIQRFTLGNARTKKVDFGWMGSFYSYFQ